MSTARWRSRLGLRRGAAAALAAAISLCAQAAGAGATEPAPCPSGQMSVTVTLSPGTVQTVCAPLPPTPMPSPSVSPDHIVGGPGLASGGLLVDRSTGVPAPPDVPDVSYVVADMDSGAVLAAKSPHAWLLPASTLKALTSLVVLPALDPGTIVTATDEEAGADGSRVGLVPGARYSVDDLLHALVLMSGNDAAYALADAYGGRARTVAAMNAKAAELGAWDTVAVDPSGLDAGGQHSSAYDLALVGRAVMQIPAYRALATTRSYTFPGGTDRKGTVFPPFQIQNHNTLLENYPGTIGVKNGYTTGARQTFIGAATRGGRTLLVTMMGGTVAPTWPRTAALLDWAFANAGRLQPVGTLVGPGAPRPPELDTGSVSPAPEEPVPAVAPGDPAPAPAAGQPLAAAQQPAAQQPAAQQPAAQQPAAQQPAGGGNPGPWLLTSASSAMRHGVTYASVALLGLLALLVALSVRSRRRRTTRQPQA